MSCSAYQMHVSEIRCLDGLSHPSPSSIGTAYWFKSRNWPDFWQEITGQDTVPEGEFYDKLHAAFYPEQNNYELPDELRPPEDLLTQPTGKITSPNRWAEKQEELLREEEDFKYQLDYDMFKQYRERMEAK